MDINVGVQSNNQRIATLKRFLSKPPVNSTALHLLIVQESPLKVFEWPLAECVPGLAHEIEAMMGEVLLDSELAECRFLLSYVDANGGVCSSKPLNMRRVPDALETPGSIAAQLDGTERASVQQQQRFCEAMMRMFLTAQQAQVQAGIQAQQSLIQIVTVLADRVVVSEERADTARENAHAVKEAVQEAMGKHEPGEVSPAMEKCFEMLERLAPVVIQKLAA